MHPIEIDSADRRAIAFVTQRPHDYTLVSVVAALNDRGIAARHLFWDQVFASTQLPTITWVFTDFDRMAPHEVWGAARVYRALVDGGARVLNNPGQWRGRADLLRRLRTAGVNHFGCWRPASGEWPDTWPVFLRLESGHLGRATALLADSREAEAALSRALSDGLPLSDLLFVEYAGAPVPGRDLFRKLAAFRIGAEIVRGLTVNEADWQAKRGALGLASDRDYAAERREMDAYPLETFVWRVFALAGLEFGRVDFGERPGGYNVWEINTNPTIRAPGDHPNPDRAETTRLSFDAVVDALAACARRPRRIVDVAKLVRRHEVAIESGQKAVLLRPH